MAVIEVPRKSNFEEIKSKDSGILEVPSKSNTIQEVSNKSNILEVPSSQKSFEINNQQTDFSQMSPLMKTVDIISRPGYAIKSGIQEQIAQEQGKKPKSIPDRYKAMIKGFTGENRVSANELFDSVGINGIPGLGFAGEFATDPLMYMGGAGYKAIPKTIGFLANASRKIPGVEQIISSSKQLAEPTVTTLKKLFVDKSNISELNDLVSQHLSKREYLKNKSFNFGIQIRNQIQNISTKYKLPINQVEREIVSSIEQPQTQNNIQEIQNIAGIIKTSLSDMLTKEIKAGVPITALSEGNRAIEYFPRIAKEEAIKYLKQAKIGNSKIWNPKIANAIERKTGDFTLAEFNDFVKANGLESLGGKSVEQFFLEKPATALVIRGARSAKAITSAEFLKDVSHSFGKVEAPNYWVELPQSVQKLMPSLRGTKFDPDVANEINRISTRYINPAEANNFLKVFDNVQNTWKRWTLAPFPKYHIRNMIGNVWNNYLADVNPTNYGKAQALQFYRKFKDTKGAGQQAALKQLDLLKISPQQADDIIRTAEETNVLGHGWYGGDVESSIEKAFKGQNTFIGKAMSFGTTLENNSRLAHFIDRLDKGNSATDAALSVKKYLFDYHDMTDFERQVMKRIFPFYTWTRKNFPLQLESLAQQPQKFAPFTYSTRDRNASDLLKLKYTRPDLYERLPIELRRNSESVTYIPLEGLIPGADLVKIGRPQEVALELLSPYLKGPLELAFNKSLYNGKDLQHYDAETQQLLKLDIPVKVKYALTTFLPQARILNEVDRMIRKKNSGETLTPGEQNFTTFVSSVYKISLEDLRDKASKVIGNKLDDLEKGAYWAKKYGREKEVERIKQQYHQVKDLLKRVREK